MINRRLESPVACDCFLRHASTLAIFALLLVLCLPGLAQVRAGESLTADDVTQLMKDHPLSVETWPRWRDYYIRLYFVDVAESPQFYEQVRAFHRQGSQEAHPADWETDPIVWAIRAIDVLSQTSATQASSGAVEYARKALTFGDPEQISSMCLATTLIRHVVDDSGYKGLTDANHKRLAEAESLLEQVFRARPDAKTSAWQGMVALLRSDRKKALPLFQKATEEQPKQEWIVSQYLVLELEHQPEAKLDLIRRFIERFPESSAIHAGYAYALFRSYAFAEADAELETSRRLGDASAKLFPPKILNLIESSAGLGPEAVSGLKAFDQKNYSLATAMLREAWQKGPKTNLIAQRLLRSQLNLLNAHPNRTRAEELVRDFTSLTSAFPDDGELHVGRAVALSYLGEFQDAQKSLDQAQRLGANVREQIEAQSLRRISEEARKQADQKAVDEAVSTNSIRIAVFVAALLIWVGVMFAVGMLLAVCIPRTPEVSQLGEMQMSSREIWLERFYLIILGISLILFYLSVPFVTLGIFAVSLALFGILLVLRVLHLGVLYRGFWATWHMLRTVFWGSSSEIFGLEAKEEDHPRLFAELASVAEQIDTRVVDQVFLTPNSSVAVSQQGAGPFGLFGRRNRVLHLGVSILPWLTIHEFRSILAHEYAHFSHHDTFFSRFVFQVSNSLANSMAVMKAAAGSLNYVNPFYAFYWLYLRGYALLSAGYSRSREFLADRRAVAAYGKQPFISGLTKICQEGDLFDSFAFNNTARLLVDGNAFLNVFDSYREFRNQPESAEYRTKLLEHVREKEAGWFDSHPTINERIAAAECFPDKAGSQDAAMALDLINDPTAVEETLTKMLTERIHQHMVMAS
jgi:Zn-dependent protease with chaperone function